MDAPLDGEEFERWRRQADSAADTHGTGTGLEAWGHDLTVLCARAEAQLGRAWPGELGDPAARLARHYIATRYPDARPSGAPTTHYTDTDAAQAEDDARALLGAVDEAWQILGAA